MKKKVIIGVVLGLLVILMHPLTAKMKDSIEIMAFQPLSGVTIVLDPGHGGKDNGAMAGDVKEQEINLSIAKKTKKLLENAGAKVILTRDGAYDLASSNATNRKREDMKKRSAIINDPKVDMFISIHLNSYPSTSVKGTQVYFRKGDEEAQRFANMIQNHFKEITDTKMVPKAGDFYLLNKTVKLGVLAECGFISNAQDRANLVQDDYQNKIAECLFDSVREYLDMLE